MTPFSTNRARQARSYLAFAIVAVASLVFWAVELSLSMASFDTRREQLLVDHQKKALEYKAEAFHDTIVDLYQNGRMISLLPAVREARGGNRRSVHEDVVSQGRLSVDTHRMLQGIYENLASYVKISEIYYVLDGFDPSAGMVPFFMYDDVIRALSRTGTSGDVADIPQANEGEEYQEIVKQLAWFRENAPTFRYATQLNTIPAVISPLVLTCDTTQYVSKLHGQYRDAAGLLFSLPVYDTQSGRFKGQISIIVRANVFEARLLGIPFIPVTPAEDDKFADDGWKMPPVSPFILTERGSKIEVSDRRNPWFTAGLENAKKDPALSGRWASVAVDAPGLGQWELHHYLSPKDVDALVGSVQRGKHLSMALRTVLLLVLSSFLAWGFWMMRTSRRELIKMAHYDSLTDLPNRRLFFERMVNGMARAKRDNTKMGLFFVDLAGLNAVNDRHGHQGGDLLLVKMARRLRQHLRQTDGIFTNQPGLEDGKTRSSAPLKFMLSRLGGDEFTIVCEDLHSSSDLAVVAERIIDCVKLPFSLGTESIEVALNVGAAIFPDDADDAERLLMSADSAMHECKNTHGRYVLFNEEMRVRAERLNHLTIALTTALQKGQFELYYQPKAMLLNGKVVSMEALIRWHHPMLGLVSPVEFIPILERNGSIVEVGEWIVRQACRDLHVLTVANLPQIRLSVNVSVRQLRRGHFHEFLQDALEEYKVDPHRLILEITETMVMDDLQKGKETLQALKQLGVSLAIDDFGAGYSSLTYLQHLPLDSLKIDKSLIDGMLDERSIHVVASVIRLAQGLSLKTIAEGIETEEQRRLITQLGCDMIQGYLLSRPQPLQTIIEWIKERQLQGDADLWASPVLHS